MSEISAAVTNRAFRGEIEDEVRALLTDDASSPGSFINLLLEPRDIIALRQGVSMSL